MVELSIRDTVPHMLQPALEEKLAEIETQPKGTLWYNAVEQQQVYKDEIMSWRRVFGRERYCPEIKAGNSDAAIARCASAINPSRVAPGSAMEVNQRLVPPQGSQITAHANFIMTDKKGLAIRRAVQSPYTGELMWRTEIIRDQAVIQAYLRQRHTIENLAHNRGANEDEGDVLFDNGEDHMVDLPAETRLHLSDLKRALGMREADARNLVTSHMATFLLPQPNVPKKEVIRRCGNCGQLGHMKTNKKCPRYFEFNLV
ncbi:hypothetical protein GGI17_003990 [Coemansia sp. S146]|nr:hypothetical protein GGI17_003990 [Coemansia sp. S146]